MILVPGEKRLLHLHAKHQQEQETKTPRLETGSLQRHLWKQEKENNTKKPKTTAKQVHRNKQMPNDKANK